MTAPVRRSSVEGVLGNHEKRVGILEATVGGGGIQFNAGTYGSLNVGDWLSVEADNAAQTPGGYTMEFGVGRAGMGIHPVGTNYLTWVVDIEAQDYNNQFTSGGLKIDLYQASTGLAGMEMTVDTNASGSGVQGATWSVNGGGGGGAGGLDLFVTTSGGGGVHGIDLQITADTGAVSNGFNLLATSNTNNVKAAYIYATSGTAATACTGLELNSDGSAGTPTNVYGLLVAAFGGTNNYAIKSDYGNVEITLQTGETLTVKENGGNPIFRVDEDGDLHGLTGKALTFDL